ncbi:MAG TPA: 16S rRNA (guanine(527)-N(7))-methyltransferase RsmG [Candidatus Dorea intestinavium]|nr:16S rRNA (guanine(527)-N(7))-methyltransferase RsmG [Candidatus Dorea intestinavium]
MNRLKEYVEKLNVEFTAEMGKKFQDYYELLITWNEKINLTAITQYDEVITKHFIDSLAVADIIEMNKVKSVIDIGTGAGFPGIPLKIVYPHLKVALLDSLNKRINFLNEVITDLELDHVLTIHGRAEDFGVDKNYRERYDLCVSRAVANLSTLSEYSLPFIKVGGIFAPYKAGDINEEMANSEKAIKILGGKVKKIRYFELPDTDIKRSIPVIEKIRKTEKKYPRKAPLPGKKPL